MEERIRVLPYDLQWFAKEGPGGEKTENATPKKLQDARREGQVAKSQELGNAVTLLILFLVLKVSAGNMGYQFIENFHYIYSRIPQMVTFADGVISARDYASFINEILKRMLLMLLPLFSLGVIATFVVQVYQVKWAPTTKPLRPKFNKLNPVSGIKRIFSKEKLMELLKSAIKLILIGGVAYSTLVKQVPNLFKLFDMSLVSALKLFGNITIDLGIKISMFYLVLGFADLLYQKWKYKEDMKMTKQEVKDEFKNAEGDPAIKGKQKARMMEASRRRMMQAVPTADVVITNPTHFAVAIKYDPEIYDAPYVVAKGADFVAAKIKEEARNHNVEIVENKPLARMLYYNVDLGMQIPPELYQTVAEILAVIYNAKKRA